MDSVAYEEMRAGEEQLACDLVQLVFNELVAPDYEPEGVEEFSRFANPSAMAKRRDSGGFVLVARQTGKLVGVLEFVPPDRIAMLFVALRGRGIAKELVARAVKRARRENAGLSRVTVNSSPYAEAFYLRMGFRPVGEARTEHGIRYTPMELSVEERPET